MRPFLLLVLFATACQTTAPPLPIEMQWTEASAARAPIGAPRVLDAATRTLVQAALTAIDHRRRVALENVANVDATGWKRSVVAMTAKNVLTADGDAMVLPSISAPLRDHRAGALQITERNLDVAIDGHGFFAATMLDGATAYTRNGVLQVNADGKLVTADGHVLLPEITFPNDTLELAIAPDGHVTARTAGSPDSTTLLGQLTLHRFVNPEGLRYTDGWFHATGASGCPITSAPGRDGLGLLKQGFLERSNVQLANELFELQVAEQNRAALVAVLARYGIVAP